MMNSTVKAATLGEHTDLLMEDRSELVRVRDLVKHFAVENSDDVVRAVDGVSFEIFQGETRARR